QNFSVRLGLKPVTLALQLLTQLAIVVNFAAEGQCVAAIGGDHRLMTCIAGIDDGETPVAKRRAPSRLINQRGRPNTFIVAPTMLDRLQHRTNVSLRIRAD